MIELTGKNLGERQRELNSKVNEAVSRNVDFEQVKNLPEQNDIDKFYKIDLASKYMNIEYMIEILKSGDSLYISRALKCTWMYSDEFSNIINDDYLHQNVFPYMSMKMKKKTLLSISMHIRNEERAMNFYKYCSESKLKNIALKFLVFTSDSFKVEFLEGGNENAMMLRDTEGYYLRHFIGTSFILAEAYLVGLSNNIMQAIEISYLYTVSDLKYLDLIEKYIKQCPHYNKSRFGSRISKNILQKHKARVLNNPPLYLNILNKNAVTRNSTVENAKTYLVQLLPETADDFWDKMSFGIRVYDYVLNIIPAIERFTFLKSIFSDKYPDTEFEMDKRFYTKQYFNIMTSEQKEEWALKQIESQKEILGIGKDYIWYKFVNFDKAFQDVKKMIMVTPDNTKRADMVNVLIESAKNQCDLEKLFQYYYDRHVNEQRYTKENFIDRIMQNHNVYNFDGDCWSAFNKIFYSLEVYSMTDYNICKSEYKLVSLIYNIIHKKEVHEAIKLYINTNMYFYSLKMNTNKLTKTQVEMVYQWLLKYYVSKIVEFENQPYEEDVKFKLRKYIHFVLDVLYEYGRNKNDCPEIVSKYMKLDWDEFKFHKLFHETLKRLTLDDLMRYLKKDAKLIVENLPQVENSIEYSYNFNMNMILNKLKIYFPNDIAKNYLDFFKRLLANDQIRPKVANLAVHGIFILADDKFKDDFMKSHAPTAAKIDHVEMKQKLLYTQEAICAMAMYSRPPVPLQNILMYVKGDYVHSALPLFNSYLSNLPLPLCMEFVEAILDTPVSIQKHGLRLAFACFNADNLKKLVLYVWRKTKNVSLRMIIYKAVFNKIVEDQQAQDKLFEALITFTLELNQDDDDETYSLLTSNKIPKHFLSDFINAAWTAVSKLPEKAANIQRRTWVISYMYRNIQSISEDTIRKIVEEFINSILNTDNENNVNDSPEYSALGNAKWYLTASYITNVKNKDDVDKKLEPVKMLLTYCLDDFNTVVANKYVKRILCWNFIQILETVSYSHDFQYYEFANVILEYVLTTLQNALPIEEIYTLVWKIRLGIIARNVLTGGKLKLQEAKDEEVRLGVVRNTALNFAKELGGLIKDFIEKGIYFTSMSYYIKYVIVQVMDTVRFSIDEKNKTQSEDMLVLVSYGLMEFKINEIYILVLDLVPSDYNSDYVKDYEHILSEIKSFDNKEIRCILYNKFVNSDFNARAYSIKLYTANN